MKKLIMVVGMIMLFSAGTIWSKTVANGFMIYGGTGYMWFPQNNLNAILTNNGYENPNQHAWGANWGFGGLVENFYFGAWGGLTIPTQNLIYKSAGKDVIWSHGHGGLEIGLAIPAEDTFIFLPTLSVGWGGFTMAFETNVNFQDYLNDPVEFSPTIELDTFSVGANLNFIFCGYDGGALLKLQYLYTLKSDWHPTDLTSGPFIGEHSMMAFISFMVGEVDRYTDSPAVKPNPPRPPRQQQMGHYFDI